MTDQEIKNKLKYNGGVLFTIDGINKTFKTFKCENDVTVGSITLDRIFSNGMNISKFGSKCFTLYDYNILGQRTQAKIYYKDIKFCS